MSETETLAKPTNQTQQVGAPLMMLSAGFGAWLEAQDLSIAFTTYQAGRIFFAGRKPDGGVWGHERMIPQCQGLWTDGQTIWTSSLHTLWRFENALGTGEISADGADREFVPREGRVTGRIDIHDIGMAGYRWRASANLCEYVA